MSISLEKLLVDPTGFDLDASPLQRTITRAADGLEVGDDLNSEEVARYFGCERASLGAVAPVLVVIVAGVRGGKSLLAGCAAVKGCLTADLSRLKRHEVPRFAIIAPTVDNAQATFRLLAGAMQSSPQLRTLIVGEPTADTLVLRRPDGRHVEIVVVAASRGAVTVRSRWLVGFVLDEVALFGSEPSGAAVNAEELLRAAETRLVPGAQGWLISSPYGPQGLLYELYKAHFGDPGRVLVVHAPTRALNPAFPAEQIEAIRQRDPDVAAREYDAAWVDADTAFFDGASVERATRTAPAVIPAEKGHEYHAAIDPGFRSNAFTLAIATVRRTPTGLLKRTLVLAREWRGSRVAPLSPKAVFRELAEELRPYGINGEVLVWTDQFAGDALVDIAQDAGLTLVVEASTQAGNLEMYRNLDTLLRTDAADLPPVEAVKRDLAGVRRRVGRNGVSVDLVKTPDGRHSDFAPAVAKALAKAVTPPVEEQRGPQPGTPEWNEALKEARRRQFVSERDERAARPWLGGRESDDRGHSAWWRR